MTESKTVDCRGLHPRCEFCDRREAAKDREIGELRAALKGAVRAAHHRRYHRREREDCESCQAIAEARRLLGRKEEP